MPRIGYGPVIPARGMFACKSKQAGQMNEGKPCRRRARRMKPAGLVVGGGDAPTCLLWHTGLRTDTEMKGKDIGEKEWIWLVKDYGDSYSS